MRSFFWSAFSRIRTEYGPEKTPYSDTFHELHTMPNKSISPGVEMFRKSRVSPEFQTSVGTVYFQKFSTPGI